MDYYKLEQSLIADIVEEREKELSKGFLSKKKRKKIKVKFGTKIAVIKTIFGYADKMRNNPTYSEYKFWYALKTRGIEFEQQRPILVGKKWYILDFYIPNKGLAIEIDGEYHNNRVEYDKKRDDALLSIGIRTIRISNDDVDNRLVW